MRLIATGSFRNTHKFKIPGAMNDQHVHKGAIFEVDETEPENANAIAILNFVGRIVDVDNQPEVVAQIQAEVEAEKQKEVDNLKSTPKQILAN